MSDPTPSPSSPSAGEPTPKIPISTPVDQPTITVAGPAGARAKPDDEWYTHAAVFAVVYLLLCGWISLWVVYSVWPTSPPAKGDAFTPGTLSTWWHDYTPSIDGALLLIALGVGVLGGVIRCLGSLQENLGSKSFQSRWLAFYLLVPISSGLLSLGVYVMLRGGLMSGGKADATNPYGVGAVSFLAGLFSQQAMAKLKNVAETIFTKATPGGDPPDDGSSQPTTGAPSPNDGTAGTGTSQAEPPVV